MVTILQTVDPGDHLCVCEVDSQFCQPAHGGVLSDTAQKGLPASIQMLIRLLTYMPRRLRIHIPVWNNGFPAVEKLIRQKGG